MRLSWLLAALLLASLLAALQWWAVSDFLYWRYEWFDIPMHYLGGIVIASFLVPLIPRGRRFTLLFAALTLFIGWEVFEYIFGLPREANYPLDTAEDLLLDVLGALTAYTLARNTIWRSK